MKKTNVEIARAKKSGCETASDIAVKNKNELKGESGNATKSEIDGSARNMNTRMR